MLQANQINHAYGAQTVLTNVSFVINPGEHVGLVGPNGSGKTTLLRILTAEEEPDSGVVSLAPGDTLGYLPQGLEAALDLSVEQYLLTGIAGYLEARRSMEKSLKALTADPNDPACLKDYGEHLTRFERLGGYDLEHRLEAVLAGLGLDYLPLGASLGPLSGGERTRLSLARLLLAEPSVLVLDEPTNHLDIEALEWLEDFLLGYAGAVLVVSHDRVFLDRIVTRILELDDLTHEVREYYGSYSDFAEAKRKEREKLLETWKDQQAEIRRLEADIHRTKQQALSTEQSTINDKMRRYAKKVAKKAISKEKRLQRYLEDEARVEKPTTLAHIRLDFGAPMRSGQVVAEVESLGQCFGDRWLFRDANRTLQYGERVALVGPNGSGKTTLLRLLLGQMQPTEGQVSVGPSVQLGYMPQQQETLDPKATALEIIRAIAPMSVSDVHHFLHFFLFEADEVRRQVGLLSSGQRARLLLARLVVSGANCLLLDEPINHLDIPSRQQFEDALGAFPGTVLISVHDRAFIRNFASSIWRIRDGGIDRLYEL
ncbi:MAG: ribosomal protection-like ABC-F family protein [Anaerolineales bacterium]